jgi:hypothetical protein
MRGVRALRRYAMTNESPIERARTPKVPAPAEFRSASLITPSTNNPHPLVNAGLFARTQACLVACGGILKRCSSFFLYAGGLSSLGGNGSVAPWRPYPVVHKTRVIRPIQEADSLAPEAIHPTRRPAALAAALAFMLAPAAALAQFDEEGFEFGEGYYDEIDIGDNWFYDSYGGRHPGGYGYFGLGEDIEEGLFGSSRSGPSTGRCAAPSSGPARCGCATADRPIRSWSSRPRADSASWSISDRRRA